jgi:hypothetical protein
MFDFVRRNGRLAGACIGLGLLLPLEPVAAQPTQAQQSAIRSNCRSDFMANCSGVTPGGAEALQCLQRNTAKLSPGCRTAVGAISPPSPPAPAAAAPAAAPAAMPAAASAPPPAAPAAPTTAAHAPTPEQQAALRQFCGADYMAKCGHVAPASGQALQCLQSHSAELSPNCRGALALFGAGGGAPAAAPTHTAAPPHAPAAPRPVAAHPPAAAKPAPAAAKPAPAAAARPTAQQQTAIRQSCQSDFMSKCRGVQPGGAAALQCLQRNSASLSPACHGAIAAIGGGAAPAAAPATAAAAPAAAPTPQQQQAIKSACQRDFMTNCRGVTPGGPEALACLQRNSSRLSPACQGAVAALGGAATSTTAASATPAPAPAARPGPVGPLRRAIRQRMTQ